MALYKGSQRMGAVYYGSKKISKIYKGSQLLYAADPYKPGVVILEKGVAGTYSFTLNTKRKVQVIMVGAGGGGAYTTYAGAFTRQENGGSGAMLQGTTTLNAGTYSVVVGAGGAGQRIDHGYGNVAANANGVAGGATTALGKTAGGGGGAYAQSGWGATNGTAGAGGSAAASTGFTATQGGAGDTTGVYNGYGAGGAGSGPNKGKDGYVLIKSI